MQQPKSKSKQVMEYLYRYAIQKGTSEVIEAVVPYGKIGMILWEIGHNVYEIMSNASEEDRLAILNEIQQANPQEIDQLSNDLSNDPNVIYPIALSDDERKAVARGIYQTLRQMPKGKTNPQQILQSINQGLFAGRNVLSVQNVNASHAQSVGSAVVKTLVNGNGLGLGQKQKAQFLGQYPMINGFEIKGVLGEGAYARVYLANEQLGNGKWRTCALKVGVIESEERFKREVQNMQLVNHPHVLSCWNTGRFQEQGVAKYWISMPNMGGITLEHLILGNALDLETKLLILMQMVDGLEALHQKKIVHRDLKPSNCLISSDFELKISDFGLSKDLNQNLDSSQSKNAYAIGTPAYMSPDNIDGKIGYYSDVWAFGIIAFELFSGNLPWGRDINPLVLIGNIQHKDIDPRKQLAPFKLPLGLVEIIDKCLKRDIHQRYRDGAELKQVFYRVAKEERNRIRHNRFKASWHILIEKKLIESFVLKQVQNGVSAFKLEAFLALPDVANLPLALDLERLGEVLDILSQVSMHIQLGDALNRQINETQLKNKMDMLKRAEAVEVERIDWEMAEALKSIPPNTSPTDVAKMVSQLLEDSNRKKAEAERICIEKYEQVRKEKERAKSQLDDKIMAVNMRLKEEIAEELKDFDQMLTDRKKAKQEEEDQRKKAKQEEEDQRKKAEQLRIEEDDRIRESKRVWRNKLIKVSAVLSVLAGLGILYEIVKYRQNEDGKEARKSLDFILIEGGEFMMGSEESSYEIPIHRVVVKDFYMSKTEVTVGQYRKCVEAWVCSEPNSCKRKWGGIPNWTDSIGDKENHPINCVDWDQARTFAKWVGGDLPSEAQWEYASRSGGQDIKYPWGNAEPRCEIANYHGCGGKTTPVCSKTGGNTAQGLCDMGGNVWEWVLDEYHSSYSGAPSDDIGWCSDRGCYTNTSARHVYRGGGWYGTNSGLRSAHRNGSSSGLRDDYVGFRVSDLVH